MSLNVCMSLFKEVYMKIEGKFYYENELQKGIANILDTDAIYNDLIN